MTKIAVYGGAFSPPHVGHGMLISWILATGQADYVVIVPSAAHPFGKRMAPFYHRKSWCQALVEDMSLPEYLVTVSEIEQTLPAPNYTVNLLRAVQEKYPGDRIRCVMGADNLALRAKWHGFDDIQREFDPIFANRVGVALPEGVEIASPVFPDISSTDVRRRLAEGLPVDHLLTVTVARMVRKSGLFA